MQLLLQAEFELAAITCAIKVWHLPWFAVIFQNSRDKSLPNRIEVAAILHTRFEDATCAQKLHKKSPV